MAASIRGQEGIDTFDSPWPNVCDPNRGEYSLILYFAKQMKVPLVYCAFAGILAAGTNLVTIWGVARIVGEVGHHGKETLANHEVYLTAGVILILLVVDPFVQLFSARQTSRRVSSPAVLAVLWQGFITLQRQNVSFHNENLAGQSISAVKQTAKAVQRLLTLTVDFVPRSLVLILGSVFLLTALAWQLTIPIFLWMILIFWTTWASVTAQTTKAQEMSQFENWTFGSLVDFCANISLVKTFANEQYEAARFKRTLTHHLDALNDYDDAITKSNFLLNAINAVMLTLTLVISAFGIYSKWFGVGEFVAGMMVVRNLSNYSRSFVGFTQMLFNTLGTIRASAPLLFTGADNRDDPSSEKAIPFGNRDVELSEVTFDYPNGVRALDNVSLSIQSGEKLGIVGASGAGKTTLVNLLLRLYEPSLGTIRIGGQHIQSVAKSALRAEIGVVAQDTALFHRSILENIAYGCPEATEEQVVNAAIQARAHEFILQLRDRDGNVGYNAKVGERGVRLSGGQRQRISVARLILKNPSIVVLDEATSSLDSQTEVLVQDAIKNLSQAKTVIAIAHRLSTIMQMDRVIVLERGRIVEEGRPGDLIKARGAFSKYWTTQFQNDLCRDFEV